jgi:hypothetical protein
MWGSEDHVRQLFGERVSSLEMTRKACVERIEGSPQDYCDFYKINFGPAVALLEMLEQDPVRKAAFEREFLEFGTRANRDTSGKAVECHYEYLLVVARKRD